MRWWAPESKVVILWANQKCDNVKRFLALHNGFGEIVQWLEQWNHKTTIPSRVLRFIELAYTFFY